MFPLRNKSYLLSRLVTIFVLNTLLLTYCLAEQNSDSGSVSSTSKKLLNKQLQQTPKVIRSTNNQDAASPQHKQGADVRGKPKSNGGHKHKKLNETELIRTLPIQFANDLSLQLPQINLGGYLTSALGGGIGGSSVFLKIHKTPDTSNKTTPKMRSFREEFKEFRASESAAASSAKPKDGRAATAGKPLSRHKRQTPCSQGEELDDYVDSLFRFGARIVRAMEPVTLPNATIELPDYNLQIFLYEGKGTRAYKFKRTKPAWVFCNNETISLGLTIEVEELRVAYKYRVISGDRLLFDGDLEARLSPKLQVQFSQAIQPEDSEEPVMQRVDRIRIFRLGRVQVAIRGLGNLTQSLSMLINSYLNDNQEELQPTFRMIEGDAVKMINRMVANINVPLLNVV